MSKVNSQKSKVSRKNGFMALTSVLLLSAFFIILFIGMFFSSVEGTERMIDREKSVKALSLANSCAEVALNKLRKDVDYGGNEIKSIGGELCEIKPIESYGLYGKVIKTEAKVSEQVKRIQIDIDTKLWPILQIIRWREVSEFD